MHVFNRHSQAPIRTAVILSLCAHALILGIQFTGEEPKLDPKTMPQLTALLVNHKTQNAPEHAKFMAQANQDGGGEGEQNEIPSSPFEKSFEVALKKPAPSPAQLSESSEDKAGAIEAQIKRLALEAAQAQLAIQQTKKSAEESQKESQESSLLAAKIEKEMAAYAARPKKIFLGAQAQESYLASWVERWQRKVEYVGNSFYPEKAKGKIRGTLILTAAIKSDGKVESIDIERSSGYELLDMSAKRILALGAPFDPFGAELKSHADIIYITRKWRFGPSGLENLEVSQ